MFVTVNRTDKYSDCTIGRMMIDGRFECFTLEDSVREIPGKPVSAWKIPGKTAIPAGTYKLLITTSIRFGRPMPLIFGVPGFDGVRIHCGNTDKDTEGCLLVGSGVSEHGITHSREAFDRFFAKLKAAIDGGELCEIEII